MRAVAPSRTWLKRLSSSSKSYVYDTENKLMVVWAWGFEGEWGVMAHVYSFFWG